MSKLNDQHKQLLFKYSLGLTSEKEAAEAQALINSNKDASKIHSQLKTALAPLDTLEPETCPDDLVESTVLRHQNLARSSQLRLQQLLAGEQARQVSTRIAVWRNAGKIVAIAAVVAIFVGILHPSFSLIRQKCRQHQCQMQLARIFQGIGNYSSEHDGRFPAVAAAAGAPWWKIGHSGSENQSATRNMYLLVKGGYVVAADFRCPGKTGASARHLAPKEVQNDNDFPSRSHISYSCLIRCNNSKKPYPQGRNVLISDVNPLFESLPPCHAESLKLLLSKDLFTLNSTNHNRTGQNLLFCDGQVKFVKTRRVGIIADDIFTLQDMSPGCEVRGYELPSCETDTFLAP